MAKFNIEVELDWVDEESGYTIDEEIKEQVVSGVKDALLRKATDEAVQRADKAIADKILEAEGTIQDTVDKFVETVSQEKIANIMMPTRTDSWSSDVKYIPLSEYVGKRFEAFSKEKRYDKHGNTTTYSSERKLSMAELLTWQYLEKELGTKVENMIATAKREVEESLVKSLEQKSGMAEHPPDKKAAENMKRKPYQNVDVLKYLQGKYKIGGDAGGATGRK